jgi:hypothetical protein
LLTAREAARNLAPPTHREDEEDGDPAFHPVVQVLIQEVPILELRAAEPTPSPQ